MGHVFGVNSARVYEGSLQSRGKHAGATGSDWQWGWYFRVNPSTHIIFCTKQGRKKKEGREATHRIISHMFQLNINYL